MAISMGGQAIPASNLSGLEKFAGAVFEGAQGKYTLDEFSYYDDTSLFSTAGFSMTAGAVTAGTERYLFTVPVGGTGQGIQDDAADIALTNSETNLERGADGGKFPANMAYVAVAGGFHCYLYTATGDTPSNVVVPIENPNDLEMITSNLVWSWNVGGDASPRLRYEPIKLWPVDFGIHAFALTRLSTSSTPDLINNVVWTNLANGGPTAKMRKFSFPLFFPPNVAVDCRLTAARAFTLTGTLGDTTDCNLRVAFYLRGYKLSRIV